MMQLCFDCAINNIIRDELIQEIKRCKNIIVFGAGRSGEWVVRLLRHYGIEPRCYCDNSPYKWGQIKNDLEIMSFDNGITRYSDAGICIGSMWAEEIMQQIADYDDGLLSRTWDLLTAMLWETFNADYLSHEYEFIRDNYCEFERIHNMLADEESQRTLEGILNYRLTRDKKYLRKIRSREVIYFDKTIVKSILDDREIIDGGAFDGDTVDALIQNTNWKNCKIHCYEVDEKNCKRIENKIRRRKRGEYTVILHKSALWSESGKILHLTGTELSSKVNEKNDIDVSMVLSESIDDYKYVNVGFMKIDIEGAEREALKGARETIKRYHPVLAICAYHLQDDLLVLPEIIHSIDCNYQLYLRQYLCSSGDTILYGIPKK